MKSLEIAWRVLFVVALVDLALGLGTLLIEQSSVLLAQELGMKKFAGLSPGELQTLGPNLLAWIGFVFKSWSAFIIGSSILTMGLAAKPYREGKRWAWFTLVAGHLPICLIYLSISIFLRSEYVPFIALFVLAYLVGLILPARQFLGGQRI